jgi:predicted outer membrane repeat protein
MKNTLVIGLILFLSNIAAAIPGDGFCECNKSDVNTWHASDSNFQEIQLDCAKSGDTILMEPGTYYGFQYAPGSLAPPTPGFFAVIYPQGRNIIYKKDPNSSGEVILSGLCYSNICGTVFFSPCQIIHGEGNGCQLIGLTICCSPLPNEHIDDMTRPWCPPWRGIVCTGSSPLIKDCNLVSRYYAFSGMDITGITIENPNSKLVIESCRIADFNGPGITFAGNDVNIEINDCLLSGVHTEFCAISITDYPTRSTLRINNSTISNFGGGGISVAGSSDFDLEVNSCHIVGNTSGASGGGIAWSSVNNNTMLVSRCNLIGNAALDMGGGIYSTGSMTRIEDCNIIGNIAGHDGGGIYCSLGHSTIENCRIENNTEFYTSEDPGVNYGGGGDSVKYYV